MRASQSGEWSPTFVDLARCRDNPLETYVGCASSQTESAFNRTNHKQISQLGEIPIPKIVVQSLRQNQAITTVVRPSEIETVVESAQTEEPARTEKSYLILISPITFSYKTAAVRDRSYAGLTLGAHTVANLITENRRGRSEPTIRPGTSIRWRTHAVLQCLRSRLR
jgi:hypothetical protein